ncbi:exonuclease SbcC [Mycobacterium sp. CBMA271]|uniref:putative immunity protein n=1 Tax=unclassified Mycobacteroides TaxID=2618759 RepID=UPI001324FEEC|nr:MULTISPECIES: exonuclease SbcC [unclassified Mycobacteroides]MUM15909.1 exonuclease SbcC [Mycobacteroides sp. CBMA 326]MUM24521.1 exonuclease SbcC [Mycobacteroides sp. CBMA 271]
MADASDSIDLTLDEIRQVTAWSVACAQPSLGIFERIRPDDPRARHAMDVAVAFAAGAKRTKPIRDAAWDAHRAAQEARDAQQPAVYHAARAAGHTAGAAFLHPLAKATQVHHILGSAAETARALEIDGSTAAGAAFIDTAINDVPRVVVDVLRRYPVAPPGGGPVGDITRTLDAALRLR